MSGFTLQALKDLAALVVDAQFCQQAGSQVFNYTGEVTAAYNQLASQLENTLHDLIKDADKLLKHLSNTKMVEE